MKEIITPRIIVVKTWINNPFRLWNWCFG